MVYTQLEKTDFETLGFLIENINNDYSIKEIAEKLKRPYVKIHNSIKRLSNKNIIKETIKGKSHYCSINYKENLGIVCFIKSQTSKEFLEKNKKINLIISDITAYMKSPDYILALFGSYSKGNANKHSDMDIVIITHTKDKENAERVMNSAKRLSSIEIHSLEFTYHNFIEMLKSKEANVGKEIIKNNIIFKGFEQFYDCMRLAE